MNEKYAGFIKDLPPELQEKAKELKTSEEFEDFISENDVELSDDVLDAVAGGIAGCGNEYYHIGCGGRVQYKSSRPKYYFCMKCNKKRLGDSEIGTRPKVSEPEPAPAAEPVETGETITVADGAAFF